MKNIWMLGCAGLMAGALSVAAQLEPVDGMGQREAGGRRPWDKRGAGIAGILQDEALAKRAGLSDEQLKSLRELIEAKEKETAAVRAQIEASSAELRALMREDAPDEQKVVAALDALNKAEGEMRKAGVLYQLQLRKTVDKETMKKLFDQWRDENPEAGQAMKDRQRERKEKQQQKNSATEKAE